MSWREERKWQTVRLTKSCSKTYQANVLSHLWLMQDVKEELKNNKGDLLSASGAEIPFYSESLTGSFIITTSVAGRIPSGSSMVRPGVREYPSLG